jgi:hypothetical protein
MPRPRMVFRSRNIVVAPVDEPAWMKLITPISLGRKMVMLHCGRSSKKNGRICLVVVQHRYSNRCA